MERTQHKPQAQEAKKKAMEAAMAAARAQMEAEAAAAKAKAEEEDVNQVLQKILVLVAKLSLKNSLEIREIQSAVFRTLLCPSDLMGTHHLLCLHCHS